ncbi:MAG: hypothetical protein WDM86_20695 [Rhizomicrobium sp.]
MKFYAIAGLRLGSEIELPGVIGSEPQADAPDIQIRIGEVPERLSDAALSGPTWQIDRQRFLLRVPNVARFLVSDGREIRVAPDGDTPFAEIAIFLSGTVLGILLHQRTHVVLHASAVEVGGKAILFCGPSGAGKSTLAAALNKRGYPLISDDFCAIRFATDGQPHALPDGRSLKLWAEATKWLDMRPGASVRAQLKKYYVDPGATASKPVVIGAIYELSEARAPRKPGIVTPNVADAALLIRRNAYRPLLVKRMGQQARYFEAASRLANAAGIYMLARPLDFAQMDTVFGWLETHWMAQRLLPEAA